MDDFKFSHLVIGILIGFFVIVITVFTFNLASAKIEVWVERQKGLAELARAESNRKIKILEADATMQSAKYYADSEIVRAKGVAEANKIIGDSLKENEAYLRYRWIEGLQTNQMQVVYIPTEAGLPILEAARLKEK